MKIVEIRRNGANIYNIYTNEGVLNEQIKIRSSIIYHNEKTYMILYDNEMNVDERAFQFINYYMFDMPENTRSMALYALKIMKIFEGIIHKPINEFDLNDAIEFRYFLHGYSTASPQNTYYIHTKRGKTTINRYMTIYRSFLKMIGCNDSIFFEKSSSFKKLATQSGTKITSGYAVDERTYNRSDMVPEYITDEQYKSLMNILACDLSSKDANKKIEALEDIAIIRIMYETGMRIGEVLGLTAEDIYVNDDPYCEIIEIRNRYSDNPSQCAKTCMHISSREDYSRSEYQLTNWGYQYVVVPMNDLPDLIDEYINAAHQAIIDRYGYKYHQQHVAADRVTNRSLNTGYNYYIFLNSYGNPMTQPTWNARLRRLFERAGIPVDVGVKRTNLSHRFRHGCVMWHINNDRENFGPREVQIMLRHKSILSGQAYFKPTISDQLRIKNGFSNAMKKMLKGGDNNE